ncbi:unnamed protein product [Cuscuta campestris]|uniref:CBM20 domain-containing protein n=1 Tax=Cuscuta campestris TaxID=132261 RepID=A0A484NGJ0_9ASTE|nr:unnamed protein product [Cuscuta campestris]
MNLPTGSHGGDNREDQGGSLLHVSLKIEDAKLCLNPDLVPHVFGSVPLAGSWNPSKALPMERGSTTVWQLSFVVPPNHETMDFKFILKPMHDSGPCIVEEGANHVLVGGKLQGECQLASFKFSKEEFMESKVYTKVDLVSPFDLAASWRAFHENRRPSTVRGMPDVIINSSTQAGNESGSSANAELDIENYVVPSPAPWEHSGLVYAANLTETPRSLNGSGEMEATTSDPVTEHSSAAMVESKFDKILALQNNDNKNCTSVDRGVGSPRLVKSPRATNFTLDPNLSFETKNPMPAAAGAVAAAAIADRMLGPKEERHLAIVLVGLPARGKTFTAAKLTRYLRWLGHHTKHFNVGKYRRLKHGTNKWADFFRGDNPEGLEARNEVAALAMEDMIAWMQEGGQVGVFDATNSTGQRRNMLMKMAEGRCKIIFLETICNDPEIIERNIRLKVQQSPDYAEQPDFEAGYRDFKNRLANYQKVYEPVEEGSYIKLIDMVSGKGGQIQVNNISGYLPGRIVFFLVNMHLTPRPILLTRHGESVYNVRGRIGGDTVLSEAGELYAKKLANFMEKRLKNERAASIWTSTLQRTILTAGPIAGLPKIQWRALDEINVGVCDGMTYEEVKKNMPEEYESREKDKLRYRYPRGESYLDVIQRLEPVIIELERQRAPVVVISHQAVLRALYAYFADRPLKEIPNIEVPLHTIIEIQMGVTGVQEKRYKLM